MKSLWNERRIRGLSRLEELILRSRWIGAAPRLCVWGGGNTSAKTVERDLKGIRRRVLRVKGSGSDLKSCEARHFTPLDLDAVVAARRRAHMTDAEMVRFLASCQLDPAAPRASIEALLHAFVPHVHIDHTHADAILAVTNQARGRAVAARLFGKGFVWIPYVKPGFLLAKKTAEAVDKNPGARGVILEKHGLITWGRTGRESYERTIRAVTRAERYFAALRRKARRRTNTPALSAAQKRAWCLEYFPVIRRTLGLIRPVILTLWDNPTVTSYLNHPAAEELSRQGPATPDHMLRTRRVPLFVRAPGRDPRRLTAAALTRGMEGFAREHRRYFERFKKPGMKMLDPYPRIILVPGVGLVASGASRTEADTAAEVFCHSMRVRMDAQLSSPYRSLDLREQFEMEYWDLELYKLSKLPPEKELARRVALVTGACGAIGRAVTHAFLRAGAHVAVADLSGERARKTAREFEKQFPGRVWGTAMDITHEIEVRRAIERTVCRFGGIDILVSNAGIAHIASLENLRASDWDRSLAVNATGHFLAVREAIRYLRRQGMGGSLIFITTKNVLAPGRDFGAYSASKAAEAQLARIAAIENGAFGIRSNMINPDGVFDGSGLWSREVRRDRARSYGIRAGGLEEFYRRRNLLQARVTAEDVAESALFLAGGRSAKTTGCILTVDGGLREAFPR